MADTRSRFFYKALSFTLLILLFESKSFSQVTSNEAILNSQDELLFRKEEFNFKKNGNAFLMSVTQGQRLALLGRFKESNECFEKAYLALGTRENLILVNERFGFEYEIFMLLYLKALNYSVMKNSAEAQVECNRMKEWVSKDSSKHRHYRDEFKQEPMPHLLLGIIYETEGLFNDAFIEYESAYRLYQKNYLGFFGISEPVQLQRALLKAALLAGLTDDYLSLSDEFNTKQSAFSELGGGELIFIYHTGVGPYQKEEPADFEINANSISGKLFDSRGASYKFETAFQINFWKHEDWWTSLPRGIYYVRVPLQLGQNKFELTLYDTLGQRKNVKFEVEGNGSNQVRVFTSFESDSISPHNENFNYIN